MLFGTIGYKGLKAICMVSHFPAENTHAHYSIWCTEGSAVSEIVINDYDHVCIIYFRLIDLQTTQYTMDSSFMV